jgi:hypothetical protein
MITDNTKNYEHAKVAKLAGAAGAVNFSQYAKFALQHYYKNSGKFIGTKHSDVGKYHVRRRMDCITLVLRCLDAGFRGTNNLAARSQIWSFEALGAAIQQYLVNHHNWSGVYYVQNKDLPPERLNNALKKCSYFDVEAKYLLSDYQNSDAEINPVLHKEKAVKGVKSLAALRSIEFGFGISYSGDHTWILSDGMIYESHWRMIGTSSNGPNGLFEKRTIRNFTAQWKDGMIIVPSLEAVKLLNVAKLSCSS